MKGIKNAMKIYRKFTFATPKFTKKMYVVLWKGKIRDENSQKIYIWYPIFFQENVRLEWKKPLGELVDNSPEMSEINQRDASQPSL